MASSLAMCLLACSRPSGELRFVRSALTIHQGSIVAVYLLTSAAAGCFSIGRLTCCVAGHTADAVHFYAACSRASTYAVAYRVLTICCC